MPARADLIDNGEVILPLLYRQMKDEGTFEMFFHDFPELTFGQFVRVLSEATEQVHAVCLMDGEQIKDIAALAMLTDIRVTDTVKRALGNFLLFKAYWGGDDSARVGAVILDAWFQHLDEVAGVTPELNDRALRFVEHMGFVRLGTIPNFAAYRGKPCGSVATYLTRRDWMNRREDLFGSGA
jgi:RimJ/RimL family protein N-acetyltransferase